LTTNKKEKRRKKKASQWCWQKKKGDVDVLKFPDNLNMPRRV